MSIPESREKESGKNHKNKSQTRIARKKNEARIARKKESGKNSRHTRFLPGEAFLASTGKILSTRIPQECQDLIFQARILYRRNGKGILTDNQEKQESGKK